MAVIRAEAVSKRFLLRHNASVELKVRFLGLIHPDKRQKVEEFWALKGVSLSIDHGEAVGLVGRNGSGKSTFLKVIAAIHRPTSGRMLVARGARISSMIELGVGFHPELTGRENVVLNASIHGLSREQIDRIYHAIVEYSGLEHFIDVPIKNYSSGMHMRLGFAISANLDPDILLLDEIFAVGDADFQQRCIGTVKRFMDEGKTIFFVSHSAGAVQSICRRVCVLEHGELVFDGEVAEGLAFYDGLLARGAFSAATPSVNADEADPDLAPHRIASGGHWTEVGHWQFDFLRSHGLEPHHHVLDLGCGSLATAVHLIPFLRQGRFVGVDRHTGSVHDAIRIELPRAGIKREDAVILLSDTFDLAEVPGTFDYAFAESVFASLPFHAVARCIVGVVRKLNPAGRFYATWFENPDPTQFEPIAHPSGVTTYPDREPYHHPLDLIATVCEAAGAQVERVPASGHPRGESMLVIRRR